MWCPVCLGGLEWGKEGLKVFFWAPRAFKLRTVRELRTARLSKWKLLLPQFSCRGVLVASNLVALALLTLRSGAPGGLNEDVQRTMLDFFWSGKHWVQPGVLYLPVAVKNHLI